MIDATVLFLTFTDQHDWGFSGKHGLDLNCSTDVDDNWHGPLCQVFSRVIRYDLYENANRNGIAAVNRDLVEVGEVYHPQYVIYPCNFSDIVTVDTLEVLRQGGAKIVAFFFDDDVLFETHTQWILPHVDFPVTTALSKVDAHRRKGARVILSNPLPHNPSTYRKMNSAGKRYDATFVGTLDHGREDLLSAMRESGSPVVNFGWKSFSQKLSKARMVRIFNESRVNLNLSLNANARPAPILQIKGRVFETALCGGFVLTEYAPGLEDYFEIGREIDSFRTAEEAAKKIRFYLDHPVEREAIAQRGFERAQRQYTAQTVFKNVFSVIESQIALGKKAPASLSPTLLNPLREGESESYYRWAKALLRKPEGLRHEWRETARMAIDANPRNKKAQGLVRKATRWGDPEPIKHLLRSSTRRSVAPVRSLATRLDRKMRNARYRLVRKSCSLKILQAFRRHSVNPMAMERFAELWKLAQASEGGPDALLRFTPPSAVAGPGLGNSRWAMLFNGASPADMSLAPASLEVIERAVKRIRPNAILELGSGASTVVLAAIMQEIHPPPHSHPLVFSIEQDMDFLAHTRSLLARHRLDQVARLLHAPLAGQDFGGFTLDCYDLPPTRMVPFLDNVRPATIIIDGPAGETGCRFGTLPLVRPFVRSDAIFYLDDAFRDGEARTLLNWIDLQIAEVDGVIWTGKGLATGRIKGSSTAR